MNKQDMLFKKYWESKLAKGRLRYSYLQGVPFGFGMFVILNLFKLQENNIAQVSFTNETFIELAVWLSFGVIVYASVKWLINQSHYRKIMKREIYSGKNEK